MCASFVLDIHGDPDPAKTFYGTFLFLFFFFSLSLLFPSRSSTLHTVEARHGLALGLGIDCKPTASKDPVHPPNLNREGIGRSMHVHLTSSMLSLINISQPFMFQVARSASLDDFNWRLWTLGISIELPLPVMV